MSTAVKTAQTADAKRVVDAAMKKAGELKVAAAVAVVDVAGHLLLFERADSAAPGAIEQAQGKAWTAAAFRVATKQLGERAAVGGELYGLANAARVVILPGGVPLLQDNMAVGAVGVAGGSPKQDQEIAEAAAKAF